MNAGMYAGMYTIIKASVAVEQFGAPAHPGGRERWTARDGSLWVYDDVTGFWNRLDHDADSLRAWLTESERRNRLYELALRDVRRLLEDLPFVNPSPRIRAALYEIEEITDETP